MSMMNEKVVLQLNAAWQAICVKTPEQAFVDMAGGALLGLVIEGEALYPVEWDAWLKLPVLNEPFSVRTGSRVIRIPTVVIARHYNKMPMHRPRLTRHNVFRRDHYTCAYTGRKLTSAEASMDHIIPVSRNGKTTWENVVTSDRKVNERKRNLTPAEAGLPVPRPTAPRPVPASMAIQNARGIADWNHFLKPLG